MFEILPNPSLETLMMVGRAVLLVGALWVFAVAFIRWRRLAKADQSFTPAEVDLRTVKRFLWAEAGLFLLIPIFAALMARGYGAH